MSEEQSLPQRRTVERDRSADLRWIALARLLIDLAEQLSLELERIEGEIDLEEQLTHELQRVEEMIAELSRRLAHTQQRVDALASRSTLPHAPDAPALAAGEREPPRITGVMTFPPRDGSVAPKPVIRPIAPRRTASARASVSAPRSMLQTINQQTRILAAVVGGLLLFLAVIGVALNAQSSSPSTTPPGEPHATEGAHHADSAAGDTIPPSTAAPAAATNDAVTTPASLLTLLTATPPSTTEQTAVPGITRPPASATPPPVTGSTPAATGTTGPEPAPDETASPTETPTPPATVTATSPPVVEPSPAPIVDLVPGGVGSPRERMAQVFGPETGGQDGQVHYQDGIVLVVFSSGGRATALTFVLDTDDQQFTREQADELAAFYRPPDAELLSEAPTATGVRRVYRSVSLGAAFAGENPPVAQPDTYVEEVHLDPATGTALRIVLLAGG